MSYKVKAVYTKPNDEVSLHTPPAGLTTLINNMFDAGKITQKPVETIDGLTYTYEIVFTDQDAFNEYNEQEVVNENYNIRLEHCTTNAISHSVEEDV